MNESEIFLAASQIEDMEVRAAFLESVCRKDAPLRTRIEKLLAEYLQFQGACDQFVDRLPSRVGELQSEARSSQVARKTTGTGLAIGSRVDKYEILACLGVGGMGEVYLAHDDRLDRKVALKVLPLRFAQNPQWIQRFEREARAASALNHPNILTIHEIGMTDDFHYMASEYIDGSTLRSILGSPVTLAKKLDFSMQIAEALHRAHSAGIVHRDIKPENIMVRLDGLVKVLDFGIATSESVARMGADVARRTDTGLILGTIQYMSPEQAKREDIDHRSDLYSLGVVLHELMTGVLPYQRPSDTQILTEIISPVPLKLQKLPEGYPEELEGIIRKLLRKDREYRYQSAKEVSVDLKEIRQQLDRSVGSNPITLTEILDTKIDSKVRPEEAFDVPEVRYARSGQVNIAYQVLGHGDIDLVFVMGWVSHLDYFWKDPSFKRFLRRLASFSRLILFDKRGTGLSDRVPYDELPTLEQRMDDVRAVMDAVGSERAILCGVSEGGPMCTLFAATYPQKTIALVMMGSYARRLQADDYPWGPTDLQHAAFLEEIRSKWGGPVGIEARAPSLANDPDFRNWWATYLRMGASPGAVLALTKMNAQIDIRPILQTIQVPTIVLHRKGDRCLRVEEGRFLADHIPGAKFVELPGEDHLPFVGKQDEFLDPIQEFLTGVDHDPDVDRVLATVLIAKLQALPVDFDTPGRLSQSFFHFVREIELFRGKTIHTTADMVSATFDGPARAVRAAVAVRESAIRLGIPMKLGIHTGECTLRQESASGPAFELAEKVAEFATPDRVLVSSTVKDLVAGSGIQFESIGRMRLSDELSECNLFCVAGR